MLVSADDRIVHLARGVGRYLVMPGGDVTKQVFRLVRQELVLELRAALGAARATGKTVRSAPVRVDFDGVQRPVVISVTPALQRHQDGFALVVFDEHSAETKGESAQGREPRGEVRVLEDELGLTHQRLQVLIEEYEIGQEEMRASNEELQSTNEELRSTLEELETSKEELQSMNEELQMVNQENRHKVEELAQLSGDLQNLLAATDIATLFLDRDLRIMRFTQPLGELFNIRVTDRGRPISDLTHRLGYDALGRDAESVLAKLVPIEREVADDAGRWYLTRLRPYRTLEDRIVGVVITFVEVTELKAAQEELLDADRHRVEFLAILAHELRSPLGAAKNGLALLDEVGTSGSREALQIVERQLDQLTRLASDLLEVNSISRGKLALNRERVELCQVLHQALQAFRIGLGDSRRIELDVPQRPVHVDADPARILQVLNNLLENARKFTEEDGLIRVSAAVRGGEVVIDVEDDGAGIAPGDLARVFDMFAQSGDRRQRDRRAGLGIGLTLAHRLVELHGGTIEVHSELDRGSRFTLRLPVTA
jgi:two-component system CheB/CheR fusion protein